MREVDRIPDYLVAGLLTSAESDEEDRTAEQEDRTAEQEVSSIWQRVDVSGVPVIVRSSMRRKSRGRRPGNHARGI